MYKPYLNNLPREQGAMTSFGGVDKRTVIPESSFEDMKNMSSDYFPLLSPRNHRSVFNVSGTDLHGLFSKSKIGYIKSGKLYYGGSVVEGINLPPVLKPRRLVSMGAYLVIFPDKLYVNTNDLTDYGSLEASFTTTGTVTVSLCAADGSLYSGYTVSAVQPVNAADGALWVDTSVTPAVLRCFSEILGLWEEIAATSVRISATGIGGNFAAYDGVRISGLTCCGLNGSHVIVDRGNDYITFSGIVNGSVTQNTAVTVERTVPDMDFVCESGNRLWGCSSSNNEIYASKLGDAKNWNCFMGISTDSYAVSVGSDGEFTGAIPYRGYVLFFKENCVHKIYGSTLPFTVLCSYLRGVQKGSERSLVCVNESLYYKSPNGVCSYEGGIPVNVSKELGNEYYTNAVSGALRDKLYICMSDKNGVRHLFVYDTEKRLWNKEDNTDVEEFATHNCNLYFIADNGTTKRLYLADGENMYGNFTAGLAGYNTEQDFEWSAQTGAWGLSFPQSKYYTGFTFRFTGEAGATVNIFFEYDSSGEWLKKYTHKFTKTGSVHVPVSAHRCDHIRLKFSGTGKVRLMSVGAKLETGGELNV